jgi:undecaprenyl diphosphate synthase
LPQLEGHRRGYERLKTIAEAAFDRGVQYVSAYAFSTENWNRSKEEVNYLMGLLFWVATHEAELIHKKNIKIMFFGLESGLPPKVLKAIKKAETLTAHNTHGTLILCVNYGGQQEIAEAVRAIIADGIKPEDVKADTVSKYVFHPEVPALDLIVRTSGEQRISNFMLWRAAYSELLFVQKHWPAFTEADLETALADFAARQRRFGK